jgi:uncharacterized membrane protein YkvA (DUF1232 family)
MRCNRLGNYFQAYEKDGFMFKRLKLTIQYLKDKNVPFVKKLLILGSVLYLIFPVDIVPDFILGFGILDDIAVISFIWFALKSELDEYGKGKGTLINSKSKVIPFSNRKKDE